VQKKERKKERTNETFCSYPTTKRRRLGTSPQAASSAQLLHTTTPFSTAPSVYPPLPVSLRQDPLSFPISKIQLYRRNAPRPRN